MGRRNTQPPRPPEPPPPPAAADGPDAQASAPPAPRERRQVIFAAGLILLAGALAYSNSLTGPFILDDPANITDNPRIHQLWPPSVAAPNLLQATRPVTEFTLALNWALHGRSTFGYHLLNLAIHLAAALLLFGVIRRTLESARLRDTFRGAAVPLAAAAAMLWVVHPLTAAAVTYIVQRGESLMALFYLLTLYCFIRGTQPDGGPRGAGDATPAARRGWLVGAVAACALGMGCKEVMVTAPLVVLLYDLAFVSSGFREALRRHRRTHLALAATWLVLVWILALRPRVFGVPGAATAGFAAPGLPSPLEYAGTQFGVVLHYLVQALWPYRLALDYGNAFPVVRSLGEVLLPGIPVVALLLATLWAWWRRPALGFVGAWFFVVLAPTSSFMPIADLAFEHRMYLPLGAVVLAVVLGLYWLGWQTPGFLRATPGDGDGPSRGTLLWVGAGFAAAVLALGGMTWYRNLILSDDLALWRDAVQKYPANSRAQNNYGFALLQVGKVDQAEQHLLKSIRRSAELGQPNHQAHHSLGRLYAQYAKSPDPSKAAEHFRKAIDANPFEPESHTMLGVALVRMERYEQALPYFRNALKLKPANVAEVERNYGLALYRLGRAAEAIEHYRRALQTKSDDADTHYKLGLALAAVDDFEGSARAFRTALKLDPKLAPAADSPRFDATRLALAIQTLRALEAAVERQPADADAQRRLGELLDRELGLHHAAVYPYQQALRFNPAQPAVRQRLERILTAIAEARSPTTPRRD